MTKERQTRGYMSVVIFGLLVGTAFYLPLSADPNVPTQNIIQPRLDQKLQAALDAYLAQHRSAEHITGISAYISVADNGPGIEFVSGTTGRNQDAQITGDTLFQIGSNTKAFTAALLLALERDSKLNIDQTVGDWLPQYPLWKDVTIRRLLNMTSGIPNYSETLGLSHATGRNPNRHWTHQDLIDFAYPTASNKLPENTGWFYSNTNYILAGMIAEKASGMSYADALRHYMFEPTGLYNTFYEPMAYETSLTERMASGYFYNTECEFYAPNCKQSGLVPIIGQDLKTADISWAGPAGGMVSTPRDLAKWVRAIFTGLVLPKKQLIQMLSLVSTKTGKGISDVSDDDPRGFSLGFVRMLKPGLGKFWFYQGETLGYRVVFGWFPQDNLVITIATNTQPEPNDDHIGSLLASLHQIATAPPKSE